jgi:two-component system response regulator YesN
LGVVKYLLKPAGIEKIAETVQVAADLLKSEWKSNHQIEEIMKKWQHHLPRLQQLFFQNWVSGSYSEWEIMARGEELFITLEAYNKYIVVVADMDPLSREETRFSQKDIPLLHFSLHSIASEHFAESPVYVFQDADDYTTLLFCSTPNEEEGVFYNRVNTRSTN